MGTMNKTTLDKRFFESTRGQIVKLLRDSNRTVNEIAGELQLTDNAIRAHLLSLERDQLVAQTGSAKGHRKPHFTYGLTDEARHLFPNAYDSVLNTLLAVLKDKLSPAAIMEVLREAGRKIGFEGSAVNDGGLDSRLKRTLSTLESLGGAAKVVRKNGTITIKSESCPFSEVVAEHPEVCRIAESMIGEIVGKPVTETCDRTSKPKCRFEIDAAA